MSTADAETCCPPFNPEPWDEKEMYRFYTTCPKCAKKYGKNYVVLLVQV